MTAETRLRTGRRARARRFACAALCLLVLWAATVACAAGGSDFIGTEWYQAALLRSEMALGNNTRLLDVIRRAQSGEQVTLAVIGGSVTEGAGASTYKECWASRLGVRFGQTYGRGTNVSLINAGVGGTPSPFGWMRYRRDIVDRVPETDPDGYPDLVVIEFSVNDWQEPTNHRCYESMVRDILAQPNRPAVILLFAVFKNGWNLQQELRRIGDAYDLMMVSIRDGLYPEIGPHIGMDAFFSDEYHPTSTGHRMMSDCLMQAIADAAAQAPAAKDLPADHAPVYGDDFSGIITLYADQPVAGFEVSRGGFAGVDSQTYRNMPVGWVCGPNYAHRPGDTAEPLTVTGVFRKCLVAWKASAEAAFGAAEVYVDGKRVAVLQGAPDKWGQSEVLLALDAKTAAEHRLEIRVRDPGKRFTVTAISVVP